MEMEDLEISDKKCGEVFLTLKGMAIFHCTVCESKYDEAQNYGIHIIDKHVIDFLDGFEILESEIDNMLPDIFNTKLEHQSSKLQVLNESSLNEDQDTCHSPVKLNEIEMKNGDSYDKKSGEVYLTKSGIMIFSCFLCNSRYEGVQNYIQHAAGHYSCTENIENKLKLLNEDAQHENDITYSNEKNNDSYSTQEDKKSKKSVPKWKQMFEPFFCSERNKELYKCKLCGGVISHKSNIHHHISRVHDQLKRFECTECHKLFHDKTDLKIHVRYHTGEKPYLCVECGRAYVTASELNRHILTSHTKCPVKACPICGKTFASAKNLSRHRAVHTDNRPFKCKVCEASFKLKKSLKMHDRIHEDKRLFKCNLCSASYNYKSILVSHMKSKHAVALE